MKFHTPEGDVLMEIKSVTPHDNSIMLQGKIMGTMPLKAVLKSEDLRAGFGLLTPKLVARLLAMLFRRSKPDVLR